MSDLALLGGTPVRDTPFPEWPAYSTEEEAGVVLDALRSGHLCGAAGGTYHPAFEEAFASWCGATGAVTCNSGSSAIHVALEAVGVGPGDEVIVPVYTYYASGTSVLVAGAIPVFADIPPGESNLAPGAFEAAITDRTKAVMVVHADGVPANMDAICEVADRHGISIVEDCSHAHGASYRGIRTGILGDVGAFSIQHKKILSVGEGGVVVSKHPEVVERARAFVNLGGGTDTGVLGPNLRMGEMPGALALKRMTRVDDEHRQRRDNADGLLADVADLPGVRPVPVGIPDHIEPVYYNLILAYEPDELGIDRKTFSDAVQAEGVPLRSGFYKPLNLLPVFAEQQAWPYLLEENKPSVARGLYGPGKCPVGEAFMEKGHLELKVHPPVGEREMWGAGAAIKKVIEGVGSLADREARDAL